MICGLNFWSGNTLIDVNQQPHKHDMGQPNKFRQIDSPIAYMYNGMRSSSDENSVDYDAEFAIRWVYLWAVTKIILITLLSITIHL